MADMIETTTAELDTALAKFEQGRASLYGPDGGKIYSEAVHEARMETLTSALHGVAERALQAVDAEIATVARLEEAEHDDPTRNLTPAELQLANGKALFVREDAMGLPLPQLLTRLRGIAAATNGKPDKVEAFLWSRYAYQRLESEAETARAGGHRLEGTLRDQLDAIDAEVSKLRAIIAPASGISKVEAQRRLKRARETRSALHSRVSEVDGTKDRIRREMERSGLYRI